MKVKIVQSALSAFFLSCLFFVTVCSRGAKETARKIENGQENLFRVAALLGEWTGPCAKSLLLSSGAHSVLKYAPNSFECAVYLFGDSDCKNPNALVKYQGEYSIGSSEGYPEGVHAIDYRVNRVTVTPLSDAMVNTLETTLFCGLGSWKVGQEADLTVQSSQIGCALEDTPNQQFDIFKVSDNQLETGRMGVDQAPVAKENRPQTLSSEIYVRK